MGCQHKNSYKKSAACAFFLFLKPQNAYFYLCFSFIIKTTLDGRSFFIVERKKQMKNTINQYGWIVVVVIIIAILIGITYPGIMYLRDIFIGHVNDITDKMPDDTDSVPPINYSELAPGLYETGTDYLLKPWDELIDEDILSVTDGVLALENGYDAYGTSTMSLTTNSLVNLGSSISSFVLVEDTVLTGYLVVDPGVTSIDRWGFELCQKFTGIVLPDTVTEIGGSAFLMCQDFSFAVIPDSVTTISDMAFAFCTNFKNISIPAGVENIGIGAFTGCSEKANITVDANNEHYYMSGNCLIEKTTGTLLIGFSDSTIPDDGTIKTISTYAFYGYPRLKEIHIPDSVTSIEEEAFYFVGESLESITVGADNTVYHSSGNCLIETDSETLILGCNNSVIPNDNSVTSIIDYAFGNCVGLRDIYIPASTTDFSIFAFSGCTGVTSIEVDGANTAYASSGNCLIDKNSNAVILGCRNSVIPTDASITMIDYQAFDSCKGLTSITIPGNIKVVEDQAFASCKDLKTVIFESGVETIGIRAFNACENLTDITLSDTITTIKNYAFAGCKFTSVTIPASVTTLYSNSFASINDVESIVVDSGNTVYHSDGNCIIQTATKTLITGYNNSVIPNNGSVTKIGADAFIGRAFTSVTIPTSITAIGDCAFQGCENLTVINFEGTIAQWNSINLHEDWHGYDGDGYPIHCTDGDITK